MASKRFGTPTSKQMERINELAKVELEPEQVFVFPNKLVGDMVIPDRYMQIHKSLLNVFKNNAIAGVSLLLDHSWKNGGFFGMGGRPKPAIPYGRTFDAKLKKSDVEGEEWSLFADHYIVKGKEIDGISTDSIIASIEDGTFFDTSIGWGANTYVCSICGNDYRNYDECNHYMGEEYDEGVCHAIVKPPGGLYENSLVWDGAYPGAGVLSIINDVENSAMTMIDDLKGLGPGVSVFHTFSARNSKLLTFAKKEDMTKGIVQGVTLSKGGGKMDEKVLEFFKTFGIDYKEGETKLDETLKQVAEKWDANIQTIKDNAATSQDDDAGATPDVYLTEDQVADRLGKRYSAEEVLKLANDGIKFATQKEEYDIYRKETVENALAMGVRAMGNDFPKDTWETTFAIMAKKQIEDITKTWEKQAKDDLSAGRKTDPKAGQLQTATPPDEAFKIGK